MERIGKIVMVGTEYVTMPCGDDGIGDDDALF